MRVGAVQMISHKGRVGDNVAKALDFCDRAAQKGVQMLCLPECASTGFEWLGDRNAAAKVYAEPVPGPMVAVFAEKAYATGMYIIFGVVERPRSSRKIYNAAFLVGPEEGYMGRHRKVHAEKVFAPGTAASVFDTRYGKVGIFICADQRSPELSRLLVLKGARVLFQPTNYFHADGIDIRRRYMGKCTAQRARAMDNGVHLVIANAGRPEYVNNSRIVEPNGQGPENKLAYATRKEQLMVADIEYERDGNRVLQAAACKPWLFKEMGNEMIKAARRRR